MPDNRTMILGCPHPIESGCDYPSCVQDGRCPHNEVEAAAQTVRADGWRIGGKRMSDALTTDHAARLRERAIRTKAQADRRRHSAYRSAEITAAMDADAAADIAAAEEIDWLRALLACGGYAHA